jgi:hypothetical protein
MRYETGFQWGSLNYDKILYFCAGRPPCAAVAEFFGANGLNIWNGARNYASVTGGWITIHKGSKSDGSWNCYEVHLKADTLENDGIAEFWVNAILQLRVNATMRTKTGWTHMLIGSNQRTANNGRNMYADFDDMTVSNTGRIGCIGTHPAAAGAD